LRTWSTRGEKNYLIALHTLLNITQPRRQSNDFFRKPSPPTFTSKYYKPAAGAAVYKPKYFILKSISKCIIKKINTRRSLQAAAGYAFDRLEGEGIKINRACTPLGKRWLSSARLGKKNNKKSLLAEHYFF
jgi:hypothetical protein